MSYPPHVVDLAHYDEGVSFHALKDAGAVGVILKATQGAHVTDPRYEDFYQRAVTVFGRTRVQSYHFLNGEDPAAQMAHYLAVTQGRPGRWLDYETNRDAHGTVRPDSECTLGQAVQACHILEAKQGRLPGMYGGDKSLLGEALDAGHFTICELWIARYGHMPEHKCKLWQFQGGEINPDVKIGGQALDLSTFLGPGQCGPWLDSLCH